MQQRNHEARRQADGHDRHGPQSSTEVRQSQENSGLPNWSSKSSKLTPVEINNSPFS